MASIGTDRTAGTGNLPQLDPTLNSGDVQIERKNLSRAFRLTPETYTTIDDLIKATKEDIMPDLVEAYGDQGLTGFLKLTGAVNSGGSSDQIDWWEAGRRHRSYTVNPGTPGGAASVTISDADFIANVQKNDVVMDAETGVRFIVQAGGATTSTSSPSNAVLVKMDNTAVDNADVTASSAKFLVIGNIYGQGTNQPTGFTDPGIVRYTNPYMIVKDRYEVSG